VEAESLLNDSIPLAVACSCGDRLGHRRANNTAGHVQFLAVTIVWRVACGGRSGSSGPWPWPARTEDPLVWRSPSPPCLAVRLFLAAEYWTCPGVAAHPHSRNHDGQTSPIGRHLAEGTARPWLFVSGTYARLRGELADLSCLMGNAGAHSELHRGVASRIRASALFFWSRAGRALVHLSLLQPCSWFNAEGENQPPATCSSGRLRAPWPWPSRWAAHHTPLPRRRK